MWGLMCHPLQRWLWEVIFIHHQLLPLMLSSPAGSCSQAMWTNQSGRRSGWVEVGWPKTEELKVCLLPVSGPCVFSHLTESIWEHLVLWHKYCTSESGCDGIKLPHTSRAACLNCSDLPDLNLVTSTTSCTCSVKVLLLYEAARSRFYKLHLLEQKDWTRLVWFLLRHQAQVQVWHQLKA